MTTSVLLAALAAMAACGGAGRAPVVAPPPLEGTSWKLASLPGAEVAGDVSSTVAFGAGGAMTGSDGCNRYRGAWTASGTALTLSPGPSTRMACPEPAMRQAAAFLAALSATRSHAVDAGRLVLSGAGGEPVATLVPLPVATSR